MKDQFEIDVTEEEIEFFQENGFLSINQITTDEEIDWMRGLYDQLFNDRWGENEGNYFDLGGRRSHQGPDVFPQVLGP